MFDCCVCYGGCSCYHIGGLRLGLALGGFGLGVWPDSVCCVICLIVLRACVFRLVFRCMWFGVSLVCVLCFCWFAVLWIVLLFCVGCTCADLLLCGCYTGLWIGLVVGLLVVCRWFLWWFDFVLTLEVGCGWV